MGLRYVFDNSKQIEQQQLNEYLQELAAQQNAMNRAAFDAQINAEMGSTASTIVNNGYMASTFEMPDDPESYYLIKDIKGAKLFLDRNKEAYNKEIAFYITSDEQVIILPWRNNTHSQARTGVGEVFKEGYVTYEGKPYRADYFGHIHFISEDTDTRDRYAATYFNDYQVNTLIYFNKHFYYYTDTMKKGLPLSF